MSVMSFLLLAEVRQLYPRFIECCCPWVVGGCSYQQSRKRGTKVLGSCSKTIFQDT